MPVQPSHVDEKPSSPASQEHQYDTDATDYLSAQKGSYSSHSEVSAPYYNEEVSEEELNSQIPQDNVIKPLSYYEEPPVETAPPSNAVSSNEGGLRAVALWDYQAGSLI